MPDPVLGAAGVFSLAQPSLTPVTPAAVECKNDCVKRGLTRCYCNVFARPGCTLSGKKHTSNGASAPVDMSCPWQAARHEARTARDRYIKGRSLVNLWRDASLHKKQGAIKPLPTGSVLDFDPCFQEWLKARGLQDHLVRKPDQKGWHVYGYTKEPPKSKAGNKFSNTANWEQAFHGSWWYSVWMLLHSGLFLASDDRSLGHDYWEPGVYCTPNIDTGLWYARPQVMFGDGVFHRLVFELRVDISRRTKNRQRGGVQWVCPSDAVKLHAVWVRSNAPPAKGEERVNDWEPHLEAVPLAVGENYPPATVNPRTTPWEHTDDPHAWDPSGDSVPPWLREPSPKNKAKMEAAAAAEQKPKEKHTSQNKWNGKCAGYDGWSGNGACIQQMMMQLMMGGFGGDGWGVGDGWGTGGDGWAAGDGWSAAGHDWSAVGSFGGTAAVVLGSQGGNGVATLGGATIKPKGSSITPVTSQAGQGLKRALPAGKVGGDAAAKKTHLFSELS